MTSSSGVGTSNIQLTFGSDRDIDGAARDVQAAIVAAHADLPSSLTRNPSYRKLNSALFPVMAIAMTSNVLTQGQIYDAADAVISQRLSQIKGVGGVNVNGSALPAVRVEINPLSLSNMGSACKMCAPPYPTPTPMRQGCDRIERPALPDLHERQRTRRRTVPQSHHREPQRNDGAPERCRHGPGHAGRRDGNIRTYGLYNGKPAVFVQVYQQPGANVIEMIDAVKAELPLLKSSIDRRSIWS